MAWLYQRPDSGRWWIGYRHNGVQVLKSTGQEDKKKAEIELAKVQAMLAANRAGTLTLEVFQAITGRTLPTMTLKAALADWMKEANATTAKNTIRMYEAISTGLTKHFHATDQGPLVSDLTREQLQEFLNQRRAVVSAATANLERRILTVFFRRAKANGTIRDNQMEGVKPFKTPRGEESTRRPFTATELAALYQQAPNDFWRYMVLGGFFTGLRLGDLATMPIGAVDLAARVINILTRKTGQSMHIPIAAPLYELLCRLKAQRKGAKPTDPLWPEQAKLYEERGSGPLSNEFFELMLVKAGLVMPRTYDKFKVGRAGKRQTNAISFHCFRHSYVSTLAALGQNQQIVKALTGHSSDQINDIYTKLPPDVLKQAVALLPDITQPSTTEATK
jgi:integrase